MVRFVYIRIVSSLSFASCLFLFSSGALAFENFQSDITAAYPPGCATLTTIQDPEWSAPVEVLAEGPIMLTDDVDGLTQTSVNIQIIRQGCSEPGRSVLLIGFQNLGESNSQVPLPNLVAQIGDKLYELRIANEPNTWIQNHSGNALAPFPAYNYWFISAYNVLDALADDNFPEGLFYPSFYNAAFRLLIRDFRNASNEWFIDITAYDDSLRPVAIPINGRLSGNWVSEGAVFQGLLVTINELPDARTFFYLSWYTFDSDNKNVWLTTNADYQLGDTTLTMPIYKVDNQVFLGDSGSADLIEVGEITVVFISCNELKLTWQLDGLGLGSGMTTFTKLFAAEISGYACMDSEQRITM
jgi:hypothetical protein